MDKKIVISFLVALAIAVVAYFIIRLTLPLAEPLVWAVVIGVATHHQYERLTRRFPEHPGRAAGLMVAIITLCIILPIAGLIFAIAQNATSLYQQSQQFINQIGTTGSSAFSQLPFADRVLQLADRFNIDIMGRASQMASSASGFLINAVSGAVKNVAHFGLTLAMAVFILFFIYRDGEHIVDATVRRFAGDGRTARHYLTQMRETTSAVVVGTILTCLAQGFLAGIGYFWAGVPAPTLFGSLTAIAAIIPVVGTALVWVPLAGYLAITGAYLEAGGLAAWCAIFVGISDNLIRPLTIGSKRDIPVMAVVFGAVGGAEVMGFMGLLVGPILFALLVTVWRDATGTGKDAAPPPAEEEPAHPAHPS